MITAISGFSLKRLLQKNSNNKPMANTFSIEKDPFVSRVKCIDEYKPSFTSKNLLPFSEILTCCDKFLSRMEKVEENSALKVIYKDLIIRIQNLKPTKKVSKENKILWSIFKHNLINTWGASKGHQLSFSKIVTSKEFPETIPMSDTDYIAYQKESLTQLVTDIIKPATINTELLLKKNNKIVYVDTILNWLHKYNKIGQMNFKIKGKKLLKDKKVKDPLNLYYVLSQPLLNAQKYSEGKPFKVIVEKVLQDDKEKYYISFINPDTKPIPDDEIDKILVGDGHRASDAIQSGIKGSGFGFEFMLNTLIGQGYRQQDLQSLIEKGRRRGVCVRVPIFGIVN